MLISANLTARNIFILITLTSYLFICTGIVNFINVLENGSLTIKEKVILMLIHLMKVSTSLATSAVLILLKSNGNAGIICWLSLIVVKFVLVGALMPIVDRHLKLDLKKTLLILANLNTPIQIKEFIQFSSEGHSKLDRNFLMVWIISGCEICARLICIFHLSSEEEFYKIFLPFNYQSFMCLILLMEYIIFVLWYLFLKKVYLWRNLVFSSNDHNTSIHFIHEDISEAMEMEQMIIERSIDEKRESDSKLKRSKSYTLLDKTDLSGYTLHSRRNSYPLLKPTLYPETSDNIDITNLDFLNEHNRLDENDEDSAETSNKNSNSLQKTKCSDKIFST